MALLLASQCGMAQVAGTPYMPLDKVPFSFLYGGSNADTANDIEQTTDGGYIMAGNSYSSANGDVTGTNHGLYDAWVVKLDATGAIVWQKLYGGSNIDSFQSIQQTADGGYIMAGNSYSSANGDVTQPTNGDYDAWVVKINATGDIQWQKTYGGSSGDQANIILQTADGGYIFGGPTWSSASGDITGTNRGDRDTWVVKLNASGNIQWQKLLGGSGGDYVVDIKQTSDTGYIFVGASISSASGDVTPTNHGSEDFWILKLNNAGTVEWQKLMGGSALDRANSVQLTSDGGYIVAGHSASSASGDVTEASNGSTDYWVVKLNSTGAVQWQKLHGGSFKDENSSIVQTADGGYMMTGSSASPASGDITGPAHGSFDCWVVKLDASGDIQWEKLFGGTSSDMGKSIKVTADGNYIMLSESQSPNGDARFDTKYVYNLTEYWVVKFDTLGNILWIPYNRQ